MKTSGTPIGIKWLARAWFQIKTTDQVIYFDPAYIRSYFRHYPTKNKPTKRPTPTDGLPEDLEKADIVLVTHQHGDHCKTDTISRLVRQDTVIVAPQTCVSKLGERVKVVKAGDHLAISTIRIKVVDAYNSENSAKVWHPKGMGVGYILNIHGKTIYHAGDTDFIPEMQEFDPIDVALLPIGGRTYTMDIDAAVEAALAIKPKVIIPMHEIDAQPAEFKSKVEALAHIKVMPLQIGEVYNLS